MHARLLHRIYQQKLSLSINQLSRSLTSGDEVPIARLMTKLLAGKPSLPPCLYTNVNVILQAFGVGIENM